MRCRDYPLNFSSFSIARHLETYLRLMWRPDRQPFGCLSSDVYRPWYVVESL